MSFDDSNSAGNKIITAALQSPNYAQGSSGWTINRDGSAEFQNVLVRGTITASTIIGSTIIGGTIIGGDLQSTNFSNSAHTGFDLNATATTDAAGTPANTIQIYTAFLVGPTGGNQITLAYNGTASAITFNTNNPADGGSLSGIGATTITAGTKTITAMQLQTAVENGGLRLQLQPSSGTSAADFPAQATFLTTTPISPITGNNGVLGIAQFGSQASDVWSMNINNENSVVIGGVLGYNGLTIGNAYTPQSRLAISPSEILSVNGAGNVETLFLNENNTESVFGGVASKGMRSINAVNTSGAFAVSSGGYTNPTGSGVIIACPPSGIVVVHSKFTVNPGTAALTSGSFIAGSVQVTNTTQGTTPFTASDNRCAEIDGTWLGSAVATNSISLTYTTALSNLGNPGDSLTIQPMWHQGTANQFTIRKIDFTVVPSF